METLSILIMNWRDIRNPDAGGAEVFTHEVARRWTQEGHTVGLFTSRFPGAKTFENIDGIEIHRAGGRMAVYHQAPRYWKRLLSRRYDIVIDEINTRPFNTPAFVNSGKSIFALIHQLAREYWFHETPFPISYLGYYFLERRWLARYEGIPCVTVSESTKRDLLELGFEQVCVVPEGLSVAPLEQVPEKSNVPSFVFVGRLTRAKKPDIAIRAFRIVKRSIPNARLSVVGDGYMRNELERMAPDGVTFFGKTPEEEKLRLIREAHVILVPGTREGWGLVVLEANALGTPAVAFNIPGLRDSVLHNQTGILLEENCAEAMAKWCLRLIEKPELTTKFGENALEWSRRFSWDITARAFMSFLRDRQGASEPNRTYSLLRPSKTEPQA